MKKTKVKLKTPSCLKRRLKITASGLVRVAHCGLRHGMTKRNSNSLNAKRNKLKIINISTRMKQLIRSI